MTTHWWKFWRRRPKPPSEATQARIKAERDLAKTKAETPRIRELALSLIEIQQSNHLGHAAARVLRGEK